MKAWIGRISWVAQTHKLQVTEQHFEKAVQNPVQQASASPGDASSAVTEEMQKPLGNRNSQGFADRIGSGGGIRNSVQNAGKTVSIGGSAVKSAAVPILADAPWAEIRDLIESCPDLSPAARRKLIDLGDIR